MAHLTISGATAPQVTAAVGPDHALRLTLSHITLVVTLSPEDTHALAHQLAAALGSTLVPGRPCTSVAEYDENSCVWLVDIATKTRLPVEHGMVLQFLPMPAPPCSWCTHEARAHDAAGACTICGWCMRYRTDRSPTQVPPPAPPPTPAQVALDGSRVLSDEKALLEGARKPPSTDTKAPSTPRGDVADVGDSASKIDASLAVTGPIPSGIALCICGEPVAQHATRTDGTTGPCLQASCTCQRFTPAAPPQRDTGLHGPLTFAEHMTLTPEEDAIAQRMGLRAPVPAVPAAVRFTPCVVRRCQHLGSIHHPVTGVCLVCHVEPGCVPHVFQPDPAYGPQGIP